MDVTKLTKPERRYMMETLCKHLHRMPEQDIRIAMASIKKEDFNSFIHELSKYCFDKGCAHYPQLRMKQALLQSGNIDLEIRRAIGEIHRVSSTQVDAITSLPGFQERMQLIHDLHNQMKGKGKVDISEAHPQPPASAPEAHPVQAATSTDVAIYTPPTLSLLRAQNIIFLPAARLGQGAFAFVCKVKVNDAAFKDDIYAAKCMTRGDGILSKDMLACHEATSVPLCHRGIIRPLALVRDPERPMVIYQYWNGGHLEQWIQILYSKGGRPMGKDFVDTIGTPEVFCNHILYIINGLLQTLEFMHYYDFGHNDLHGRNILLHFGSTEVYVGIADWGRSATYPTVEHFPKFSDAVERKAKKLQYKHVAPECFSEDPPPYSKKQEVYTICHHISRLLNLLPKSPDRNSQAFVSLLTRWASKGTQDSIEARPDIFDLVCVMGEATRYNLDIVKTSGLRPFHE